VVQAQDVPASHGWIWIKQGFELFRKAPLIWLILSMFWSILLGTAMMVLWPIGAIFIILLYPTLLAVWLRICQQIDQLGTLEIGRLLNGLGQNIRQLLGLGGLIMVAQLILSIIATMLVPLDPELTKLVAAYPNISTGEIQNAAPRLLKFMVVQLIATIPIFIAAWFAPPLIAFRTLKTWHAIRWSVYACVSNLGALSIYGLICTVLIITAGILPAIGTLLVSLIITPIFFATIYVAYQDIFVD
jgi:hypothetical protein